MSTAHRPLKYARACCYCRKRKVKCDGGETCRNCLNHGESCVYPPSQRGKRAKHQPTETVESRLAKLESLLQTGVHERVEAHSILGSNQELTTQTTSEFVFESRVPLVLKPQNEQLPLAPTDQESMIENLPNLVSSGSALSPPSRISAAVSGSACSTTASDQTRLRDFYDGPCNYEVIEAQTSVGKDYSEAHSQPLRTWEHHGPGSWCTLCSEAGIAWVVHHTAETDFARIAQNLTTRWNQPRLFKSIMNRSINDEPDEETAWKYCKAYFEHAFESVMGVVYRPEFEARLQDHFQRGAPVWTGDTAWYALRNIVYAAGSRQLLLDDDSIPFRDAQERSSHYFENVLTVHTELLFSSSTLDTIRALITLAFYSEATADGGFEYMSCATAARLAQAKGLHRMTSKSLNLPEIEILHRNWLFWAIYCCEKLVSFRSDRPSAIDDNDISCEIPTVAPVGSTINVQQFTHMIKAAQLSQKITRQLTSVMAFRQNAIDLMNSADDLYGEVEAWKENINDFRPPGKPPHPDMEHSNQASLHQLYLQYMYYAATQSIYAIFSSPWVASILGMDKNPSYQKVVSTKGNKVADAARSLIMATRSWHLKLAAPQWASFYFPMSGLINLFIHIITHPTLPSIHTDLALLEIAAAHFSHIEFLTSSNVGSSFARHLIQIARKTVEEFGIVLDTGAMVPDLGARDRVFQEQIDCSQSSSFQLEDIDISIYSEFLLDEYPL